MSTLMVVSSSVDWPYRLPGVTVVQAEEYLGDREHFAKARLRVINLCRNVRDLSLGYYVSLLAEARGQRVLPSAGTIDDLQIPALLRALTRELDGEISRSFAGVEEDSVALCICFGRTAEKRHDKISRSLFALLPAPMLLATFQKRAQHWQLDSLRQLATTEIPPQDHEFVLAAAKVFVMGRGARKRPAPYRPQIAILVDADDPEPPSNALALRQFEKAAAQLGMRASYISSSDADRLVYFDALFIRATTAVDHYTYLFARQALADKLVVIDDPASIMKCCNKVYLAELLGRQGIRIPKTQLLHRGNADEIIASLQLPCVLKKPDSSFSLGVLKIEKTGEFRRQLDELLLESEVLIAQEYLPTEFDWRVGMIDGEVLFAAKYYMAPGFWQIIRRDGGYSEGAVVAVKQESVPPAVLSLAKKAANLIGSGLYGVDLKVVNGKCYVIEINDNPNLDFGGEDGVEQQGLYLKVMSVFLRRIRENRRKKADG